MHVLLAGAVDPRVMQRQQCRSAQLLMPRVCHATTSELLFSRDVILQLGLCGLRDSRPPFRYQPWSARLAA